MEWNLKWNFSGLNTQGFLLFVFFSLIFLYHCLVWTKSAHYNKTDTTKTHLTSSNLRDALVTALKMDPFKKTDSKMISITSVNTIKKHSEVFSANASVYSRWCTMVGWFWRVVRYVATGNSIVGLSCHSNRFQSLNCRERRKFLLKHPVKSTLILLPLCLYSAIHICIYIPVNYIKVTLKTATEWLLKPNKWNKTKNTRAYLHWKKWVRGLLTRAILQNIQEGISNGVFFVCFHSIFSTVFSCLPGKGFSFPFALRCSPSRLAVFLWKCGRECMIGNICPDFCRWVWLYLKLA